MTSAAAPEPAPAQADPDPVPAQAAPSPSAVAPASGEADGVTFDVVRLFGVEGRTLVEIYMRIPTRVLTFTQVGERWESRLAFELSVRDSAQRVVVQDRWNRTKTVTDRMMLDASRVHFIETHAFLLPPGTYEMAGTVTDAAGKELGTLRQTLEAPRENPPVSDLLLASRILPDTVAAPPDGYDPVRKNRLVLNPNPGGVYSARVSPFVFFYYEFRNVSPGPLTLVRVLRFREKESGRTIKEARAPKTYQPGWTVDFGAVNVAGLKEGAYTLQLGWEPNEGGEMPEPYRELHREQDFVFFRNSEQRAEATGAPSEIGAERAQPAPVEDYYEGFSVAELDSVFEMLEVFFGGKDRDTYRSLTPEGKRNFLNRFWARHDPSPSTPGNEYREEVESRLATIESDFKDPGQKGYRSPRGRIYLKLGKPDRKVERFVESGFSAPYELWIYYDSGYKYVFLDEFRNRRYILLTSTDPQEQGRPDWQELLPPESVQEILRE